MAKAKFVNALPMNISVPKEDFERIEKESADLGLNRSQYVTMMLHKQWKIEDSMSKIPDALDMISRLADHNGNRKEQMPERKEYVTISEAIDAFNTLYKVSHRIYKKSISECESFENDNLDSSLDFYKGSIAGGLCIMQSLNIYSIDEVKEIYSSLVSQIDL